MIIAGCSIMIILAGPGGRQYVFGSFAWSTTLNRSAPYGVRIISWPGRVAFERSALDPPNQTPVRSVFPEGFGVPLCHQAPAFGGAIGALGGGTYWAGKGSTKN